ncbi:hypothetical protein PGIGA_G00187250 [Pangasianodon gigas]|uniref:Uncharacterized protein n=1 Tax=Pangasianodon gigas TaxID=30993 RepID=A0ACC5WB96_PANGG|nr:hypothetical protein [Pangasianodon gigas]
MPSVEDWINNPLGVIDGIFAQSSSSPDWEKKAVDYFKEKLKVNKAQSWVPSLNDVPLHYLKPNSLVKFRCMVQDMFDPEFFMGVYETVDPSTNAKGPVYGTHQNLWGQDGFWLTGRFLWGMKTREGICFHVLGPWMIRNSKVKSGKEEGPPGLSRIQPLGLMQILKVSVVSEDKEGMLSPLQPVPPLFQCHLDGQQFTVPDVVVLLRWGEFFGKKGIWVEM